MYPKSRILASWFPSFPVPVFKWIVVKCETGEAHSDAMSSHPVRKASCSVFVWQICCFCLTQIIHPLQVQRLIPWAPQKPLARWKYSFLGIPVLTEDEIRWKDLWNIQEETAALTSSPCALQLGLGAQPVECVCVCVCLRMQSALRT